MKIRRWAISFAIFLSLSLYAFGAFAGGPFGGGRSVCSGLPSQASLKSALASAVGQNNGGLGFNMWATLVANDGTVCAVAFSGSLFTDQWLASRIISAQKASTASALSLGTDATMPSGSVFQHGLALSTANLYSAVQPGGTLYGLQESNPVDAEIAYQGSSSQFGSVNDPLVGQRVGGVNVFGGGLALFASGGIKVGGVGVSGDTSCTDHVVAWRVRNTLGLDHFGSSGSAVGGVSGDPDRPDNIIHDFSNTAEGGILNPNGTATLNGTQVTSTSGFGHPECLVGKGEISPSSLPAVQHN
jgi:hypothetical protein